jgi:carbonic anhydrase
MKALLDRARSFKRHVDFESGEYRKLAEGQYPEVLFITCSDSRVIPALITGARPGEIFELRNAGNIVPPHSAYGAASGEAATIEYALEVLGVQHLVVCGHSHCGAMGALKSGDDLSSLPEVVQRNVVNQLAVLRSYPGVRQRLDAGQLWLHGWYYEIDTGQVSELDEDDRFRVHAA